MDRTGALTGDPAQRAVVGAVRRFADRHRLTRIAVGLSGGADSLALTAAAVRSGLDVHAVVVDHALQHGSDRVAHDAADTARTLGATAEIRSVTVDADGGPEAAARRARYAALDAARDGRPVLLGHTLDDQAETVLLGLGRGSGARSLAGMRPWRPPWGRPLLDVRRAQTRDACRGWGLPVWDDPHNVDPRFTRVRLRTEVLPLLDDVLGGGVADALARTATQLRDDADALDEPADRLLAETAHDRALRIDALDGRPTALRTRVLRRWLISIGAVEPGHRTVSAVDALVTHWHGQGPIAVGGDADHRLVVERVGGDLTARRIPR
ncbi:tRNA lysidine(34) synthetase TilS [Gordonia shandongensis]|uniref:tRNA lysidine(34) synthetase TilS n=1 Tax=Gordonia shandongensis TaxID=376351 RepID=UPI0003FBF817|nr:tRNA lysidine(34) synthetase TilS [Gordonia shandongensis]